jgi:hypothetical protein
MYELVSESDVGIFNDKVRELLEDGFKLHGDLIVKLAGSYIIYSRELFRVIRPLDKEINLYPPYSKTDCVFPLMGTCDLEIAGEH